MWLIYAEDIIFYQLYIVVIVLNCDEQFTLHSNNPKMNYYNFLINKTLKSFLNQKIKLT